MCSRIILIVASVLALTGCGGGSPSASDEKLKSMQLADEAAAFQTLQEFDGRDVDQPRRVRQDRSYLKSQR